MFHQKKIYLIGLMPVCRTGRKLIIRINNRRINNEYI